MKKNKKIFVSLVIFHIHFFDIKCYYMIKSVQKFDINCMNSSVDKIITGKSASAVEMKKLISMVAPSATTVLVLGKTGTGKELVANALHKSSGRSGPLVSLNCAAIPTELLESELFGHEKGSFTGADKARAGRFEQANGGTLFLDEIGDMPIALQSKLLRALEGRTIQRVGGNKDIKVDFRLVCATHQELKSKVDEGSFRSDLYYRINVFPIDVPTLAERAVDIPLIINVILSQLSKDMGSIMPKFDEGALNALMSYPWPGNIRELRNVIERATVLFNGKQISASNVKENLLRLKTPDADEERDALWEASEDLMGLGDPSENVEEEIPLPHPNHYKNWFAYFDKIDLRRHLSEVEIVLIEAALEKFDGMVSSAADALKLRRTTLIEKMKKFMIEKPILPGSESKEN